MKKANNLRLLKSTEKAKLFSFNDEKFWMPNRAIIESKKTSIDEYTVVVEDWFAAPIFFKTISLLKLIDKVPPAKIEYTTGISDADFPNDLIQIQKEAVEFSVKLRRCLIWLWTGCGKTKIGIELANSLFKNGKVKRIYWITPPIGEEQVRQSMARWLLPNIEIKVVSINWFSYNVDKSLNENDVVIIDECHRIKNGITTGLDSPDCQLANNIRQSVYNAGYVYGLTATTCLNGELDLFGIFFSMCKDIVIADDRKVKGYLKYKEQRPIGVKSLRELIENILPYIFHRRKEDYDNRKAIVNEYSVMIDKEQSALMNRLYNGNTTKQPTFRQGIVETYTKMIDCLHRSGGMVKSNKLKELLNNIPKSDQIIIFGFTVSSQYSDVAMIKDCCKQMVESFIELHGSNSSEENKLAIDLFRKGEYRILVASYGCGSEMLDFPNANHVINFGHSLNPIHRFQGNGRVDRVIQKKQVYSYTIYVKNSVEGFINSLYNRKIDFSKDLSDYFKMDENKILNNELS